MPEKKAGKWHSGIEPKPFIGIESARSNLRGIYSLYKSPNTRFEAITRLFVRAKAISSIDAKALSLIEAARAKQARLVAQRKKAFVEKFSFPSTLVGERFKEFDRRIRARFLSPNYKKAFSVLSAVESFAKKNDCREYAAKYFEYLARRMKNNFVRAATEAEKTASKEIFGEAISHAVVMFEAAGKRKEAERLVNFARAHAKIIFGE